MLSASHSPTKEITERFAEYVVDQISIIRSRSDSFRSEQFGTASSNPKPQYKSIVS